MAASTHLQGAQLVHVVLANDVRAAGQDLAGFDERGAQRRQRLSAQYDTQAALDMQCTADACWSRATVWQPAAVLA